jgi:Methyltransferase domain
MTSAHHLRSIACRYQDFASPWYRSQEEQLKIREIYSWHSASEIDFVNRKFWEWCAIAQALDERGKLHVGSQGLGFAVGTEPLSAFFASRGCDVLATDLAAEESSPGWIERNEHASSLNNLFYPQLVDQGTFGERVSFRPADMRNLAGLPGEHNFIWSSCALEHLGTLQAGMDFVMESSRLLRKGGVAVHTTEFNVHSSWRNWRTVVEGPNVIYRRSDLKKLARALSREGFKLAPLNFDTGSHQYDREYDTAPYMQPGKRHVKLEIDGYVATSFMLVVERLL